MFEQTFKNIDDVLWKDAGCTSELDYTEQTSWLLFLKYLDALESEKAMEAQLSGKKYAFILDKPYRWESWAAPKGKDGKIDHNAALTGDDLTAFLNGTTAQDRALQERTFYGKEKKSLAYVIGVMNMILHGIEAPNILHTNPLNDDDLAEFVKLQKTFADSPKSWSVDAQTIDSTTFDLSVKNPNGGESVAHRSPKEILEEIAALDAESAQVLKKIRGML